MTTLRRILCAILASLAIAAGGSIAAPEHTTPIAQAVPSGVSTAAKCGGATVVNPIAGAGCWLWSGGRKLVDGATGGQFEKITKSMLASFGRMLELSMAWWIEVPTATAPEAALGKVNDYTFYFQLFLLTCTFAWAAISLIRARKTALTDGLNDTFSMMAKVIFGAFSFAAIVFVATKLTDGASSWILEGAMSDRKGTADTLFNFVDMTGFYGTAGLFFIALVGFIASLVTIILLIIRMAMLPIVQAAVPIAASASGFRVGGDSFNKLISWTIAFLLFKPVGALVYLVAFTMLSESSKGNAVQQFIAIVLLCLTSLVLPALMKLISSAGGGAGSGMAVGAAAAGIGIQAGMMAVTGGASAGAGAAAGSAGGAPMTAPVTATNGPSAGAGSAPVTSPSGGGGVGVQAPAGSDAGGGSSGGSGGGGSGLANAAAGLGSSSSTNSMESIVTNAAATSDGVTAGGEQAITPHLGEHGVER